LISKSDKGSGFGGSHSTFCSSRQAFAPFVLEEKQPS